MIINFMSVTFLCFASLCSIIHNRFKQQWVTGWKYLIISMISVATAMLCKEQGITVTAICAVYEIFIIQKVSKSQISTLYHIILKTTTIKSLLNNVYSVSHLSVRFFKMQSKTNGLLLFEFFFHFEVRSTVSQLLQNLTLGYNFSVVSYILNLSH